MTTPKYIHIPIEAATRPKGHSCHCEQYWAVHPEKGIAYYVLPGTRHNSLNMDERLRPQCNSVHDVTYRLLPEGHVVKYLDVVFDVHAIHEARRLLKEQADVG